MLEIEGLNVRYGDFQVLFGVDLTVKQGEIISFLGANGAGKTTTINAIAGIIRPAAGTIRFHGVEIQRWPVYKIVENGLVQIPEERMLFPQMTVLENLLMGAYLPKARQNKTESMEWVYNLFPVLKERSHQLAGTLSGGEQQMLAIGRGLMCQPRLLMLDEPSLGLAPMLVVEVFRIIRRINRHRVDILLVEQNVHQSLKISNRAYLLENGSITLEGETAKLLEMDYIKQSYLGV